MYLFQSLWSAKAISIRASHFYRCILYHRIYKKIFYNKSATIIFLIFTAFMFATHNCTKFRNPQKKLLFAAIIGGFTIAHFFNVFITESYNKTTKWKILMDHEFTQRNFILRLIEYQQRSRTTLNDTKKIVEKLKLILSITTLE